MVSVHSPVPVIMESLEKGKFLVEGDRRKSENKESLRSLVNFAIACNYRNQHTYAVMDDQSKISQDLSKIVCTAIHIHKTCKPEERRISQAALRIIQHHFLNTPPSSLERLKNFLLFKKSSSPLSFDVIEQLQKECDLHGEDLVHEQVFRLEFLADLPKQLPKVICAPSSINNIIFKWRNGTISNKNVDEWRVLELISQAIYKSDRVQESPADQMFSKYKELMLHFYKGSHFLIEEELGQLLEREFNCQAIIRASSHYEKGRNIKEWNEKGDPIYSGDRLGDLQKVEINHYGLSGKHIRHILYHRVSLCETEEGQIIPGKTVQQVRKLQEKNQLFPSQSLKDTSRHFIALQSELAPDCEGNDWLGPIQGRGFRFYTHRVINFCTYRFLKLIGVENANVGAYGFGRTDLNPIILKNSQKKD